MAFEWYPVGPGMHCPEVLEAKLDKALKVLATECLDISTFTGQITVHHTQKHPKLQISCTARANSSTRAQQFLVCAENSMQ